MCEYDKRIIMTLKYSKYRVKPTIVNGEPAYEGQVPYLVSLKQEYKKINANTSLWDNLCGGSIIGEYRVLTAAHCFEGNNFYYAHNPKRLRLVAGELKNELKHSGETETTNKIQWRKIDSVVLHADFLFPSNDIALVFVEEPWNFYLNADFIIPASKTKNYQNTCKSAGFGKVGHRSKDGVSPILLLAPIRVLTLKQCSIYWEMTMNSFICTDSTVTDVAMGDSGGPLACKRTGDPVEKPGRSVLVGVVSGKNFDKTTLYTRVSEYHDWIERNPAIKLNIQYYILVLFIILIYLLFY